jgi:3-dehydroquinate synthase
VSRATIPVELASPYSVHVGPGVLAEVAREASGHSSCAVLADARASALHGARLSGLEDAPRIEIEPGERSKSFAVLESALQRMAELGLDRGSLLVTLGGGVATDLGGLAASLYMRGIDVVHAATTLLAQVDAAVGGKTAVDLPAGRNLAGTFHQPRAVYADTVTLATLDEGELRSGLGEVVKCALLGAEGLLELLEERAEAVLGREADALADVVIACVRLKARIVASDEREAGPRRALNLGHTFAHAIEHAAGYGRVAHGVAVAAGLGLALEASRRLGKLDDPTLHERTARLLRRLGLPSSLAELRSAHGLEGAHARLDRGSLLAALAHDKKARGSELVLVLPRSVGESVLASPGVAFLSDLLA